MHPVCAWCRLGLWWAGKPNTITAIPALWHMLGLAGCIVTLNATGCRKSIACRIRAQGSHHVLRAGSTATIAWPIRLALEPAGTLPPVPMFGEDGRARPWPAPGPVVCARCSGDRITTDIRRFHLRLSPRPGPRPHAVRRLQAPKTPTNGAWLSPCARTAGVAVSGAGRPQRGPSARASLCRLRLRHSP